MSRRVLVISYFYPPFASVGAVRVSKMTRYLRDAGWESHVLTTADDDRTGDLELEVPAENITRVSQGFDVLAVPRLLTGRRRVEGAGYQGARGWKSEMLWYASHLYRNVACFPDPQVGWLRPAIRAGRKLIDEFKPDIILSSALPHTATLAAASLAKSSGLPWVAELRDLWTANHNFRRMPPLGAIERGLERRVLRRANAIVTVSQGWADRLARVANRPVHVVPNGFDPNDYPDVPPDPVFTLAYTGMFYNGRQDPMPVLNAIAELARAGEITPQTFRLRLVGYYLNPILARAESAGVLPFVRVDPPAPHREALAIQRRAAALLFFDWVSGEEKDWYSAKIYEYLGAGRPVLSIGPTDSVVARLLASTNAGRVAGSAGEARTILGRWIEQFRRTGRAGDNPVQDAIGGLTRQAAARTMGAVLDTYAKTS
jgi:glycosyltransferase involved in cell wall biosynthesis